MSEEPLNRVDLYRKALGLPEPTYHEITLTVSPNPVFSALPQFSAQRGGVLISQVSASGSFGYRFYTD